MVEEREQDHAVASFKFHFQFCGDVFKASEILGARVRQACSQEVKTSGISTFLVDPDSKDSEDLKLDSENAV